MYSFILDSNKTGSLMIIPVPTKLIKAITP